MATRGRVALIGAAALALALGGCGDGEAAAKAEAAARAKAAETAKTAKLKASVAHSVDCLNALRWQQAALAGAGIGKLDVYEAHFRDRIDTALGSDALPAEEGAPALTRDTIEPYVEATYPQTVEDKFIAGQDANGDGTVSGAERSGRGFNMVVACVNEVAESGKGPLAGDDKVARMFQMEALRGRLKDKGV